MAPERVWFGECQRTRDRPLPLLTDAEWAHTLSMVLHSDNADRAPYARSPPPKGPRAQSIYGRRGDAYVLGPSPNRSRSSTSTSINDGVEGVPHRTRR